MAELLWKAARREAHTLRDAALGDEQAPLTTCQLEDLAAFYEAKVHYADLEEDLSGFIVKEEGQVAKIYINQWMPRTRQRFTLAHEIGHLVDRLKLAQDDEYSFTDFRGVKYDLHEFFADEFAGALLMPAEAFLEKAGPDGITLERAAKHFNVSFQAAQKRFDRLQKSPE